MEVVLTQLIKQLNSSVFILLLILVATGWGLYKIGGWMRTFEHHEQKITRIEGLAEKVVIIQTKVDLIYQNTLGTRRTVAAMSPINLTALGKEIAEKLKAEDILKKYISKLSKEAEIENSKNAYDIQMAAMNLAKGKLLTLLNDEELVAVKQEAYNRGLLAEDIMSIFGVLLRNHVLAEKGYPVSDIDKYAPSAASQSASQS